MGRVGVEVVVGSAGRGRGVKCVSVSLGAKTRERICRKVGAVVVSRAGKCVGRCVGLGHVRLMMVASVRGISRVMRVSGVRMRGRVMPARRARSRCSRVASRVIKCEISGREMIAGLGGMIGRAMGVGRVRMVRVVVGSLVRGSRRRIRQRVRVAGIAWMI